MPVQKGRQQYFGLAIENTRLTAETTGFTFLPWTSLSPKNENAYRDDNSAFGTRGAMLSRDLVNQHGKLDFGGFVDTDNLLLPLHLIFGTSTPVTADGATTWSGSVNQSIEGDTATAVFKAGDEGHKRVKGWMASKIELSFGIDNADMSVEGFGILEEDGTDPSATTPKPSKKLLGRHAKLTYADDIAGLGAGTDFEAIKNLTVSYETGIDPSRHKVLGSLNPTNMTGDGFSASLSFDLIVKATQATTVQGWHDNGTEKAFRVTLEADNLPVIGTSSLKPKLTLDFPASTVEVERTIELDEYVMQKCTVTVNQADSCTYELINAISSLT